MLRVEVSIVEAKEIIKEICAVPGKIIEYAREGIREKMGVYLDKLMEAEIELCLGRARYQRACIEAPNYRNGYTTREFTLSRIGTVRLRVPRDREGVYKTQILPRYKRCEKDIEENLVLLFLGGLSTRDIEMISKRLLGKKFSKSAVSEANKEMVSAIEAWRIRDLSEIKIKYLFIDGTIFKMRVGDKVENVPVLVAMGVDTGGYKHVLSMQTGDKESATRWREFFKDLKGRGLSAIDVKLGVMDGLKGLESVFEEEFPDAKTQRCQVHVARNVISKVPHSMKEEVADHLRDIFYASSKNKAMEQYETFVSKYKDTIPSSVKSLSNSIDRCLTFYAFPEEEWLSLRTTNVIERLNKEFKRRTKTMEILPGEKTCYLILSFVAVKMELGWRTSPIWATPKKLNLMEKFTQLS